MVSQTVNDFGKLPGEAIVPRYIVLELCAISDMTRWRLERRGQFPPLIKLSERRVGYRVTDIREWLDGRREWGSKTRKTGNRQEDGGK